MFNTKMMSNYVSAYESEGKTWIDLGITQQISMNLRPAFNFINVFCAHFLYKLFAKAKTQLEKAAKMTFINKIVRKSIYEIDTRDVMEELPSENR